MEYHCKYIQMNKLLVDHTGPIESICTKCKSEDCSNPIEKRKMSVFGITKECRFFVRGSDPMFVIQCEGYVE